MNSLWELQRYSCKCGNLCDVIICKSLGRSFGSWHINNCFKYLPSPDRDIPQCFLFLSWLTYCASYVVLFLLEQSNDMKLIQWLSFINKKIKSKDFTLLSKLLSWNFFLSAYIYQQFSKLSLVPTPLGAGAGVVYSSWEVQILIGSSEDLEQKQSFWHQEGNGFWFHGFGGYGLIVVFESCLCLWGKTRAPSTPTTATEHEAEVWPKWRIQDIAGGRHALCWWQGHTLLGCASFSECFLFWSQHHCFPSQDDPCWDAQSYCLHWYSIQIIQYLLCF